MSAPTVQVESRGAVTVVTLNRPDSSNTLNLQMAMDLLAADEPWVRKLLSFSAK